MKTWKNTLKSRRPGLELAQVPRVPGTRGIWGFTSDWHSLFQILNLSPKVHICYKLPIVLTGINQFQNYKSEFSWMVWPIRINFRSLLVYFSVKNNVIHLLVTLGCQIDEYTRLFGTKETWRMKPTQRQTKVFNKNPPYSFIWPYSFNWHLRVF